MVVLMVVTVNSVLTRPSTRRTWNTSLTSSLSFSTRNWINTRGERDGSGCNRLEIQNVMELCVLCVKSKMERWNLAVVLKNMIKLNVIENYTSYKYTVKIFGKP